MSISVRQMMTATARQVRIEDISSARHFNLIRIFLWLLGSQKRRKNVVLLFDVGSGILSFLVSLWLVDNLFSVRLEISLCIVMLILLSVFLIGCLYFLGGYRPIEERRSETELEIIAKGVSLAFLTLLLTFFVALKGLVLSRYMLLLWWLVALFAVALTRFIVRETLKSLWGSGYLTEKVVLVGYGEEVAPVLQRLALQRHKRFEYFGVVFNSGSNSAPWAAEDFRERAYYENIEKIVELQRPRRAFVFLDSLPPSTTRKVVSLCKREEIAVSLISNALFGGNNFEITLDEFTGCLVLHSKGSAWNGRWNRFTKRTLDVFGSSMGILILLALLPLIWLMIVISDHSPILYKRRVVGKGGKAFDAHKFRTMCVNADVILQQDKEMKEKFSKNFKLIHDPRLIKTGRFLRKWSLDELPQFFNVLKGQMSLVGPRMIVEEELQKYGVFKEKLLTAKPGMTGFWQVSGRQNTDYDERVRMDMFYIDHWSIWMDIIILIKTVWKVVKREGAV